MPHATSNVGTNDGVDVATEIATHKARNRTGRATTAGSIRSSITDVATLLRNLGLSARHFEEIEKEDKSFF